MYANFAHKFALARLGWRISRVASMWARADFGMCKSEARRPRLTESRPARPSICTDTSRILIRLWHANFNIEVEHSVTLINRRTTILLQSIPIMIHLSPLPVWQTWVVVNLDSVAMCARPSEISVCVGLESSIMILTTHLFFCVFDCIG